MQITVKNESLGTEFLMFLFDECVHQQKDRKWKLENRKEKLENRWERIYF